MGISLYQISAELREAMSILADVDLSPETATDTLESIQAPFEDKVRAVVAYAREIAAEAEFASLEARRMMDRSKALTARSEAMKGYVLQAIQDTGYSKALEYPEFRVSVAKNPPRVEIYVEELVPSEYQRVIPEQRAPDKAKIAEAMKVGLSVPGCSWGPTTYRLSVR